MVLGTDAAVQNMVYGKTDSNKDNQTAQARTDATALALSHLNLDNDPSSPSSLLTSSVNLIAASFITRDKDKADTWSKAGHLLLDKLRGDDIDDAPWGIDIVVDRR